MRGRAHMGLGWTSRYRLAISFVGVDHSLRQDGIDPIEARKARRQQAALAPPMQAFLG
jgi:hypothetical protein